uniref:Probable methyltransferase PMT11 n=1 Tax=Tanacetum cinerariifolium TaxID=118510 RepID=A0A6L2KCF2_TANCI|nr:probable methyltransferase PMT11 [Tanacetum cinerariifolium]
MLYGSECWPITKALVNRVKVVGLRMLSCGGSDTLGKRSQSIPVKRVKALVVDSLRRIEKPFALCLGVRFRATSGSAINPYLFALILDELSRGIQEDITLCLIFADNIVLVSKSMKGLNNGPENLREALVDNDLRGSREKAKYLKCDRIEIAHDEELDIYIRDKILPPKESFRYLGSMIHKSRSIDTLGKRSQSIPVRRVKALVVNSFRRIVSLSPNLNKSYDLTTLSLAPPPQPMSAPPQPMSAPPPPITAPSHQMSEMDDNGGPSKAAPTVVVEPPPVVVAVQMLGVVDENGVMRDDFEVGVFDVEVVEKGGNESEVAEGGGGGGGVRVRVGRFEKCAASMREYIPCLDNVDAVKRLGARKRGEKFERHCPEKDKGLDCLVPTPKGYKAPIPWPRSRDEVWYNNVPHAKLAEYKGGQNWIVVYKDKFRFPGGGTQFIHGADQYLDQISKMIPAIAFGRQTRVVLDVGCGVASFGAYLTSRNVLTMSVAPKDVHENQIQFALERGVPAMVAAFATRRLLYPSQAFDLIHCSRCRVNWTRDGLDPELTLAQHPVYKHEPLLEEQWQEMLNLTKRLCWNLVKKEGYIAIWHKPLDNNCYLSRDAQTQPPLCDKEDNPDDVWYVDLKPCITPLPEDGFAAALIDNQLDCWVMNVVPVSGPNTLPVIYDRGLLGVMHDWCEAFDTYPRTYDLLHAAGLFSVEQKRCNISSIMLEMNRILRPGGRVYIRDSILVMDELQEIGKAIGWHVTMRDTSEGPHASYRILICDKRLR